MQNMFSITIANMEHRDVFRILSNDFWWSNYAKDVKGSVVDVRWDLKYGSITSCLKSAL